MYSVSDIFFQALEDPRSIKQTSHKSEVILGKSVRIEKCGNNIELYNLNKGGDYYKPLNEIELQCFMDNGWKAGQLHLVIMNCLFNHIKRSFNIF